MIDIEELKRLEAVATKGATLTRYSHGGGRLAVDELPGRKLVVDYYQENDREYLEALRNSAKELIALAEWAIEVKEELDCVNREDEISETCEECRCLNKLIKQFPKDGER